MTTSLIITTYNWKEALELSLLSVLNQKMMPTEVIIADDGSKDDTRNLINVYKSKLTIPLIHVWHEDNGFRLAQIRNKAIAKSSSEYIIQIDGDIIMHPAFIYDHVKAAQKSHYIKGSRVLLSEHLSKQVIKNKRIHFKNLESGVTNRINATRLAFLQKFLTKKITDPFEIRGCNMAFWKDDFIQVNGYNESMEGWGREDSELVARFINNGIYGLPLRLGGIAYHLYHAENTKSNLALNDQILEKTIKEKITFCEKGIHQYL